MQHNSCDLAPVSTFRIRIEQPKIRDDVLFVVDGQYGIGGCGIGDIGIKRRLLHGLSRNRLSLINFALAPWPILLMTAKPSPHSSIWDVRSTPMSRHRQLDRLRPKSANMDRHGASQRWRKENPPEGGFSIQT